MFAYCLNNPVCYNDQSGTRAQIWPILFEDHVPGYIHSAVQAHIICTNSVLTKELYLAGVGRADIYHPRTRELWEIKYGGTTAQMKATRICEADKQVGNYIVGAREKIGERYRKGHANAFSGAFILNCDDISYCVTYETPEVGVILYYVQQLRKAESTAFAVYPSREYNYASNLALCLAGAGALAAASFLGDAGSSNPLYQLGLAG